MVGVRFQVVLNVLGNPDEVRVTFDGTPSQVVMPPYVANLDVTGSLAGTHTLGAFARYGATTINATTLTVTLDTAAPSVVLVRPASGTDGIIRGGSIYIHFQGVLGPEATVAQGFTTSINGGPSVVAPALVLPDVVGGYTTVFVPVPDGVAQGDALALTLDRNLVTNVLGNPLAGGNTFNWTAPRFGARGTSFLWQQAPVFIPGPDGFAFLGRYDGQVQATTFNRREDDSIANGVLTNGTPLAVAGLMPSTQEVNLVWLENDVGGVALKMRTLTPPMISPEQVNVLLPAGTSVAPVVAQGVGGEVWIATSSPVSNGSSEQLDLLRVTPTVNIQTPPLDLGWPTLGPAALAVVDGTPYVAIPDVIGGVTRVLRLNGNNTWTALPDLPEAWELSLVGQLQSGTDVVLTAVMAVQTSLGTSLVVMQSTNGGAWTRLAPPLESDVLHDVAFPRAALDGAGNLTVAFVEHFTTAALQPGTHAVRVLRHQAGVWSSMSAQSPLPQAPVLNLSLGMDRFQMPALQLAFQATGNDTFFLYLNGPFEEPVPARVASPCNIPDPPPALLSQTGCFSDLLARTPAPGVVLFTINATLYSDGAEKSRWVVLPPGQSAGVAADGNLLMPDGTITIKDFLVPLATTPGATAVMAETRFMVKRNATTWQGYSYEWRADGSDADLLPGPTDPIPMTVAKVRDFTRTDLSIHQHTYPTRNDCLTCHNTAAGFVLGPQWAQLDKLSDLGSNHGHQLSMLTAAGYLSGAPAGTLAAVPSPWDTALPAEARVRAYLHANCAQCHRPGGTGAFMDLRYATPLATTNLCLNQRVVPGSPATSRLHIRMAATPGNGAPMPPLARRTVDTQALNLVDQWISSMTSCP